MNIRDNIRQNKVEFTLGLATIVGAIGVFYVIMILLYGLLK